MALDLPNYSLNTQTPFQSLGEGYQLGAGIRNDRMQQANIVAQQEAQKQQAQVIQNLISNPNVGAADYANAALIIPGMKDQLKQAWDTRNTDQQQSHLSDLSQYFSAVKSGNPDLASELMNKRADAMEASGSSPKEVHALRTQAQVIKEHPEFARSYLGLMLSAIPGGDKVISSASSIGTDQRAEDSAPAELLKKQADAAKAATDAGVAAATAPANVEVANLKPVQAQEDIASSQAKRRIDELNVQISQANSETQRGQLVLEREKLLASQAEKKQDKQSSAQAQMDNTVEALGVLDQIAKHPGLQAYGANGSLKPGFGGVGTASGRLAGLLAGSDRKDLEGLVDTLKSKQFLTNVQALKGTGALSDAEGARIERAVASLDLNQSLGGFNNSLGMIRSVLQKSQSKLIADSNLPTKGGAVIETHPTYGIIREGDINRLLTQHPGATREQVIQFLRGGK